MLFNNDLLVKSTVKAKELYVNWVNGSFHSQVLSTSVFCLGDSVIVTKNLKILFTVLRNKFTELGIGFTRTAETEVLKFIKQKYTDRITLNGSTENCVDGNLDVLALTVMIDGGKIPSIILQHYHGDKLNSFNIGEDAYVMPVAELHAPIANCQEAYDYFSKIPPMHQMPSCLLLSKILDTQRMTWLRVDESSITTSVTSYFNRTEIRSK